MQNRTFTVDNMEQGILRIIYGLSKKVILADYFGSVIALIQMNTGGYRYANRLVNLLVVHAADVF